MAEQDWLERAGAGAEASVPLVATPRGTLDAAGTTPKRPPRPAAQIFARLLEVVRTIPHGRVATYGQVAQVAGLPRYARHVGYALHSLPEGTGLPWHRVVGAGGAIRLRRVDGAWTQRMRLEREGVGFTPRGRVRLAAFAWRPSRRSVSIGRHVPPHPSESLGNARSHHSAAGPMGDLRRRRHR